MPNDPYSGEGLKFWAEKRQNWQESLEPARMEAKERCGWLAAMSFVIAFFLYSPIFAAL